MKRGNVCTLQTGCDYQHQFFENWKSRNQEKPGSKSSKSAPLLELLINELRYYGIRLGAFHLKINYLHWPYIPTACTWVTLRIGQGAPKGGCRTSSLVLWSEIHDQLWSFIVVDNNNIHEQVYSTKPWTVQVHVCCYIWLWEGSKTRPTMHKRLSACQFSGRHGESEALLSMIRYRVPLAMSATDM